MRRKQFDPRNLPVELVVERIEIPKDQLPLLVDRRPGERLSEWAARCGVDYDIVLFKDGFRVLPPDNG